MVQLGENETWHGWDLLAELAGLGKDVFITLSNHSTKHVLILNLNVEQSKTKTILSIYNFDCF